MNEGIALAKALDAQVAEQKWAAGAALLKEVMAGNTALIQQRQVEKLRQAQEEQHILAYIREQDAKAQVALCGHRLNCGHCHHQQSLASPDPLHWFSKWSRVLGQRIRQG